MAKNKYPVPKSAITEKGLKRLLKKAASDFSSKSDWAKAHQVTPQGVSAFLSGTQGAGLKIPEVLGYRPQIIFLPLDEDPICTANPPRRETKRPTKKVDHTREPIEKRARSELHRHKDVSTPKKRQRA